MWLPMWVFDGNGFTMVYLDVWIRYVDLTRRQVPEFDAAWALPSSALDLSAGVLEAYM